MDDSRKKEFHCSCGRSFSNARGLEFHQELQGCAPVEDLIDSPEPESVELLPAELPPMELPPRLERPLRNEPLPRFQLPRFPAVDWQRVWISLGLVWEGLTELVLTMALWIRSLGLVSARVAFFLLVALTILCHILTEVANQRPLMEFELERQELAVRAVVDNFLENGRLRHFDKARELLVPRLRYHVTTQELEEMFASLPLHQPPDQLKLRLSERGSQATLRLIRGGAEETYILRYEGRSWRVLSVMVCSV